MLGCVRFRIWVTRARERPSRRAMAAREATSPVSSCLRHSRARDHESGAPRVAGAGADLRRLEKSTTTPTGKFLLEELLGSKGSEIVRVAGSHQPTTQVRTQAACSCRRTRRNQKTSS